MTAQLIPIPQLLIALIPVLAVAWVYFSWRPDGNNGQREVWLAMSRMLVQLLLIGYVLSWLFQQRGWWVWGAVMLVMATVSTWISLRKVRGAGDSSTPGRNQYVLAFVAISASSLMVLAVVVWGVLGLSMSDELQTVIPLAGMIFSSAMTAVGLAAERYFSDRNKGADHIAARNGAFGAAMIPITNSMLAVGLVSLPGMMTGQILAGVSPLIAVRYQIVVMCMIFGVTGLAAAGFLWALRHDHPQYPRAC